MSEMHHWDLGYETASMIVTSLKPTDPLPSVDDIIVKLLEDGRFSKADPTECASVDTHCVWVADGVKSYLEECGHVQHVAVAWARAVTADDYNQLIHEWCDEACLLMGAPTSFQVSYRWNVKLGRTAGRAWSDKNMIEISPRFWQAASMSERRETVFHEVAHLLDNVMLGNWGHSPSWYALMAKGGYRNCLRVHEVHVP